MSRKAGQIISRGDDKYIVRVDLGRDQNGKRIRINKTIYGKREDAQRALNKMLVDRDLGILSQPTLQTVNAYLDHWLVTAAKPRLRARTHKEYKDQLARYVRPVLGGLKLAKLTPLAIQSVYSDMLQKGLSARTVRLTHTIFSNSLKQAVKWRILPFNPADAVDLPKYVRPEMIALSQLEAARFLEAVQGDPHELLFNLLLSTGLRPSEAIALKWSDLDLGKSRLSVKRTLSRTDGQWHEEDPKTPKSKRTIDIPLGLTRMFAKREIVPGLVFRNELGEPLGLRAPTRDNFKPALARAKLNPDTRLYDLRHTCATLLLLGGDYTQQVHIKLVSEYLGHSNIQITLDTYGHVLPGMNKVVANKMDALLFDTETESEQALYN